MNKIITSEEAILSVCRDIVAESGLQSINIRDVAKKCGVSIGSIYNYFPTKSDLIVATIESIWKEIMNGLVLQENQNDFRRCIEHLYHDIRSGSKKFKDFFSSHSIDVMQSDRTKGRMGMDQYIFRMKNMLEAILTADPGIKDETFNERFTRKDFIDFVLSNVVSLLVKKANSCDFLLEIITRTIY